jgi:hypothetical protein
MRLRRTRVEECRRVADGFRVSMLIAFSDAHNARLIYLAAGGLVLLGLGLTWLTVRWWRDSEQVHPSLEPLVVMGTRRWRTSGSMQRALALDAVRPAGAERTVTVPDEEPLELDDHRSVDELIDEFEDLREPDAQHVDDIAGRSEPADAAPVEPAG